MYDGLLVALIRTCLVFLDRVRTLLANPAGKLQMVFMLDQIRSWSESYQVLICLPVHARTPSVYERGWLARINYVWNLILAFLYVYVNVSDFSQMRSNTTCYLAGKTTDFRCSIRYAADQGAISTMFTSAREISYSLLAWLTSFLDCFRTLLTNLAGKTLASLARSDIWYVPDQGACQVAFHQCTRDLL